MVEENQPKYLREGRLTEEADNVVNHLACLATCESPEISPQLRRIFALMYDQLRTEADYALADRFTQNYPLCRSGRCNPLVEIKVHHLAKLKKVLAASLDEHLRELNSTGYIHFEDRDYFTVLTRDFVRELFGTDEQRIRVINGRPDFVCFGCRKFDDCYARGRKPIRGEAFSYGEKSSAELAAEMGVKVNEEYTVAELREKLKLPNP